MHRCLEAASIVALTFTLAACPPKADDTADTGQLPEDTGDTGETGDTLPESSLDSDALSGCGPLASVVYMTDPEGEVDTVMMIASTVEDYCGLYNQSEALIEAEWDANRAAYHQAEADGDYLLAWQTHLAWEQTYAEVGNAMMPEGSCAAQVYIASAEPGSYDLEGSTGAAVILVEIPGDLYGTIIGAYQDCDGVTDEESWELREAEVDAATLAAMPYSAAYGGSVELAAQDDALHAAGTDLDIMDFTTGELATMSMDLWAERCEP